MLEELESHFELYIDVFPNVHKPVTAKYFPFQDETTALDYDLNQLENLLKSEEEEMQRTKELYEVLEK